MLKAKIDAGATRAITQFFFENDHYFRFLDRVRARGNHHPHRAGRHRRCRISGRPRISPRKTGASVPDWLAERFAGLDDDPQTRRLIAAAVAAEQVFDLLDRGVEQFHFYTMNRADLVFAVCHLLGVRARERAGLNALRERSGNRLMRTAASLPARSGGECGLAPNRKPRPRPKSFRRQDRFAGPHRSGARKNSRARWRHGHNDPAAQIHRRAFRGERFADWPRDLRGNNDLLILTQPDAIREIHLAYFQAGADIVETNTFSCTTIAQADYGMESLARELNVQGARLAMEAAIQAEKRDGKKRFVAGAMGPTNRTASISPECPIPAFAP